MTAPCDSSNHADDARAAAARLAGLIRSRDYESADQLLVELSPDILLEEGVFTQRLQLCFQKNDYERAADLVLEAGEKAVVNGRIGYLSLLALHRAGEVELAVQLLDDLPDETIQNGGMCGRTARLIFDLGLVERAERLCRAYTSDADADVSLVLAKIEHARAFGSAIVGEHLAQACALAPQNIEALRSYGDWLLAQGRGEDALEIYHRVFELKPGNTGIHIQLARAHRFLGAYDSAADHVLQYVDQKERSPDRLRQAASILIQAKRPELANVMFERQLKMRAECLPADLVDGLNGLWEHTREAAIPVSRLEWAWSLASDTVRQQYDGYEGWVDAARWGYLADRLILDWFDCAPGRAEQALAIIEVSDETRVQLLDAVKGGEGVLLVSSHVGNLYAGAFAITDVGVPHKWVGSTPNLAGRRYGFNLISTSELTERQVGVQILSALRKGEVVTLAVDGAMSPSASTSRLLDKTVTYSDFAAKVSFKYRVPALFAVGLWKGGVVELSLRSMPLPVDEEPEHVFLQRWEAAYFREVESVVRGEPENLRLSGGVWRHI